MFSLIERLQCCTRPIAAESLDNWTVEDVLIWKQNFKAMLKNPEGFALFMKYAKTEDSAENPSFWKECEDLLKLNKEEEIVAECSRVYEEYIPKLNLEFATKERIIAAKDNLRPETFLEAQGKIFDLMKISSWPRFKTKYLKEVCEARGIEWPSTLPRAAEEADPEVAVVAQEAREQDEEEKEEKAPRQLPSQSAPPTSSKQPTGLPEVQ